MGDFVINTTGIYGRTSLGIIGVHPEKNSIIVTVPLFGNMTNVEMSIDEVQITENVYNNMFNKCYLQLTAENQVERKEKS